MSDPLRPARPARITCPTSRCTIIADHQCPFHAELVAAAATDPLDYDPLQQQHWDAADRYAVPAPSICGANRNWARGVYRFAAALPGTAIMGGLSLIGIAVPVITLLVALFRYKAQRLLIVMLIIGALIPQVLQLVGINSLVTNVLQLIPTLIVFAYAVIGTRLLIPTQMGLDIALQSTDDAVMILDLQGVLVYANPGANRLGFGANQPLAPQLAALNLDSTLQAALCDPQQLLDQATTPSVGLAARRIAFSTSHILDRRGQLRGKLLIGHDVTVAEAQDQQLEAERQLLIRTVDQLKQEQAERARLSAEVQGLSLPIIPVLDGVLVMPIVGLLDATRITQMTEVLLKRIEHERAQLVLFDVTGVPLLDEQAAAGLMRSITAAKLLGTNCILVGISPEIAQALVATGTALHTFHTAATLQDALKRTIQKK